MGTYFFLLHLISIIYKKYVHLGKQKCMQGLIFNGEKFDIGDDISDRSSRLLLD